MKIPVICVARQERANVLRLIFATKPEREIDLTMILTVNAGPDLEPDPYSIQEGDEISIGIDPAKGWPPLE